MVSIRETAHYLSCNDLCFAESDDAGRLSPSSHHPGAMLLNLQALDVDVSKRSAKDDYDAEDTRECLRCEVAPKRDSRVDDTSDREDEHEEHDKIAVDPVENESFVANDRNELQNYQNACRNDCDNFHRHTDFV